MPAAARPRTPRSRRRRTKRDGLAERESIREQEKDGDRGKDATVSARQHLKREKRDGQAQIAWLSLVQIRVKRRQRERNPLDRREVQLAEAEKSRRREREDKPVSSGAAGLNPTRRPSTYAPSPHSTHDSSDTTLTASTGFPVSHSTGAAKTALPIRFSEYASELRLGWKMFASKMDSG